MGMREALSEVMIRTGAIAATSLIPVDRLMVFVPLVCGAGYWLWKGNQKSQGRGIHWGTVLREAGEQILAWSILFYLAARGHLSLYMSNRLITTSAGSVLLRHLIETSLENPYSSLQKYCGILIFLCQILFGVWESGPSTIFLSVIWVALTEFHDEIHISGKLSNSEYGFAWGLAAFIALGLGVIGVPLVVNVGVAKDLICCCFLHVIAIVLALKTSCAKTRQGVIQAIYASLCMTLLETVTVSYSSVHYAIATLFYTLPLFFPFQSIVPVIQHISSDRDSRHLALFFGCSTHSLTASFMSVEAIYGYWSNSLGLMSDAAHMCFDSTALAIGLYASYVSKCPPDDDYSYGCILYRYVRYEVLSGLINGIFLVFIGFTVFVEGIQRLLSPPKIDAEQLIFVSFLGLGINIIGLFFFRENLKDDDSNLRGVYLHILADALGSVGVIVSSYCIYNWELYIADPICSLVISVLILSSVGRLLSDAVRILMQRDVGNKTLEMKRKLEAIENVCGISRIHVWKLAGGTYVVETTVTQKKGTCPFVLTQQCCEALRSEEVPAPTVQVAFS